MHTITADGKHQHHTLASHALSHNQRLSRGPCTTELYIVVYEAVDYALSRLGVAGGLHTHHRRGCHLVSLRCRCSYDVVEVCKARDMNKMSINEKGKGQGRTTKQHRQATNLAKQAEQPVQPDGAVGSISFWRTVQATSCIRHEQVRGLLISADSWLESRGSELTRELVPKLLSLL